MTASPPDHIEIRAAEVGDRADIVALWNVVFANPSAHNNPGDDIDRKFSKDRELFFVAVDSTDTSGRPRVVGTCMAGWDGHRGFVWYVGVHPSRQHQGIGTALMRRAESALWQQGCRKINLMIRADNNAVAEYYESLGYRSEDRLCMGKLLGADDPARTTNEYADKVRAFRALHRPHDAFVMPNPWDRGSTVLLERLGFRALATTSAGYAFANGRPDGSIARDEVLQHCRDIVAATRLPVSADFENGYAMEPAGAADNFRLVADTGLVGASIEDASGDPAAPIYPFDLALDRVIATVEAVRSLDRDFVLTARAENFLHGRPDIDDTIRRLVAFEQAGADVLYAPGLRSIADVKRVTAAVSKPVNVVMAGAMTTLSIDELNAAGVSRISLGSTFARTAYGALIASAEQCLRQGRFDSTSSAATSATLSNYFADAAS